MIRFHLNGIVTVPLLFPMTHDAALRDTRLREQLEELRPRWQIAENVVLPVIGDSALYATAAYLYDVWKKLDDTLTLELVPGVSAHSLAGSRAGHFLAMGDAIFSIIPGTAPPEAVSEALRYCDSAALYKPSALKSLLRPLVEEAGPWSKILRMDRAGLPDECITEGNHSLDSVDEYLSTLLLWR